MEESIFGRLSFWQICEVAAEEEVAVAVPLEIFLQVEVPLVASAAAPLAAAAQEEVGKC